MNKVYDLLILGAGPAGITAAVYAARKKIDFLVISLDIGGQAAWSGDIENYTGYQFITGPELALKFQEHMSAFGIQVNTEEVVDIQKHEALLVVVTSKARYQAKSVIIATGKRPRFLNVPGEKEFKNRGVTYCATCDGPLFKDKPVAVIGGGNSALDAAIQLARISPQVYMINIAGSLTGDPVMVDTIRKDPRVQIFNAAKVTSITGEEFVNGIEIEHDQKKFLLFVEGVFVEIGLEPNTGFCRLVERNKRGEIIVNCNTETSVPGIFSAGDATNVAEKQIIIACGEGSKASLAAFRYITTRVW